jgi:transposase
MYPAENSESFVDGHLRAFSFFGGVPRRIVYDNPAYAVHRKSKLTGRERDLSTSFGELRSRCLFEAAFANPASGNEKGSVERKVAVLRQNWLVPVPKASSFESLNGALLEKASSHRETRLPLFAEDAANFLARALSEWRNPADRTRPIVIRPPLCEYDGLLTGASR